MFEIRYTGKFKKDYKVIQKRNYDLSLLKSVIVILAKGENISQDYRPHKLSGNYTNCWECHVKSDWLLIWQINYKYNELWLIRTGTHSDLF
jgi:mRNA interferase YafQ